MDYTCRETIIKNMTDFGCQKSVIDEFLICFDRGDRLGQKKILDHYREYLLNRLHESQKNLDLLDFMVYQLEKCQGNRGK